jgi:predicted MPP superfamily phosphohydrolase
MKLFFTIGFDLLEWISMKTHLDDTNFHRRLFLTRTGPIITAGAALLSTGAGFVQATRGPKNKTVEIPIPNLPIEFENYTIAQISDLHIGPTIGPEYIEKTIQEANSAKPDLIALTGDLMDGYAEQIGKGFELLNKLQAPDGKFFITGNHEYFWNAIDWIQKAKETDMIPLLNEHRTIQRGEAQLVIAGVPDMMAERFSSDHKIDFEKAFNNAPPARLAPRVLLSHNPNTFEEARKHQISLQLSGHTHSGQFYPFRFFANIPYRHFRGLYSLNENQTHIYVNPGTGYWGPPNRLGIPSEITILKLKRAPIS